MNISSFSLHNLSPPSTTPTQKPGSKGRILAVSIAILGGYTLYDTFLGQQYLICYWDKVRVVLLYKKKVSVKARAYCF